MKSQHFETRQRPVLLRVNTDHAPFIFLHSAGEGAPPPPASWYHSQDLAVGRRGEVVRLSG